MFYYFICHPRIFSKAIALEKMSGIQLVSLNKIIRKILFIETYWIPDKFLRSATKFSGMTKLTINMKLSIIVNHYRTPEILKICLRSIKENLKSVGFDWEIILTDVATIEKTSEMMEDEFSEVIFIPNKENIGFGKSVNIAIEKAKGDYFLIVNADIIIDKKGVIEELLDFLEKNSDVGMVGPKLLNVNNTVQQSCFRFYTPLTVICRRTFLGNFFWGKKIVNNFLMKDVFDDFPSRQSLSAEDSDEKMRNSLESSAERLQRSENIPVDWLMGSAMMVRKSDLKKVGLFDERFFMYFEDVDWARRFWENNLKVIYFPQAVMYHYHFQSSKKNSLFNSLLTKYARIHIKSALKYFLKYKFRNVKYGM